MLWRYLLLFVLLVGPELLAREPIRALFIIEGDEPRQSLRLGIEFGIAEAAHTAKLFRRDFVMDVVEVRGNGQAQHAVASRLHGPARLTFVAFAGDGATAAALTRTGIPVVGVLDAHDAGPAGGVFRIRPDAAAVRARLAKPGVPAGATAAAWHRSLRRYGARELNQRFLAAMGQPMDEEAWMGWITVKLILEAALRGAPLASLRIDGHKGVPLRFNALRLLEQPIYIVTGNGEELHDSIP